MPVRALLRRTLSSALSLTDAQRSPRAYAPSNRSKLRIAPEFVLENISTLLVAVS